MWLRSGKASQGGRQVKQRDPVQRWEESRRLQGVLLLGCGWGTLTPENWRDVPTVDNGIVKVQTQLPSWNLF